MSAPEYYLGNDGEPAWESIERYGLNYNRGCAWKYLVRAGRKTPDPREDLRKAIACIEREIEVWGRQMRLAEPAPLPKPMPELVPGQWHCFREKPGEVWREWFCGEVCIVGGELSVSAPGSLIAIESLEIGPRIPSPEELEQYWAERDRDASAASGARNAAVDAYWEHRDSLMRELSEEIEGPFIRGEKP